MTDTAVLQTSRLLTLSDGQQSKSIKLDTDKCSITFLLKEGKNKFRKKFKYVLYNDQLVQTDENLRLVLDQHEGPLTLLLTNKAQESITEFVVASPKARGLSYIIGNENDIEQEAVRQLEAASSLKGCIFAIGMPDLHPGKGIPIGAVVMTDEKIAYPQLVDNDIGCGMSFVETSISRDKLNINKLRKLAASLESIDGPYASTEDVMNMCSQPLTWGGRTLDPLAPIHPEYHYDNLGTIGGGNHFAELQQFDEIFDADAIQQYDIDTSKIHLLVHSGSRSLGSQYLKEFCEGALETERHEGSGHYDVSTDSTLFQDYLKNHNVALNFAARNRQLIARRLLQQITCDTEPECKIDIYHNYMEKVEVSTIGAMKEMASQGLFPKVFPSVDESSSNTTSVTGWIHRKGATPTTQSNVLVIPGSRGTKSYLVEVNKNVEHGSGYSLAHGAGRKMNRSKALAHHKSKYPNAKQLLQTDLDSVVVCEKKDLVYEEAPASYKDIDDVVKCMTNGVVDEEDRGLVRVLATLRPLLTYKYKDPYK